MPQVRTRPQSQIANNKTLLNTNDTAVLPVNGDEWATVQFAVVGTPGSATVTAQMSLDGGINYIAAPYAKRVDATSANPTVKAISATTLNAGETWEVPLPGSVTHFQLLCAAGGTAVIVNLYTAKAYVPGVQTHAILYDVTSGSGLALDTGTLDVSGWDTVTHFFTMSSGTPAFSLAEVDDAGTTLANLVTSAVAFVGGVGDGVTIGGTAGLVQPTAQIQLPRRMRYQSGIIAAQTSRIRLQARR